MTKWEGWQTHMDETIKNIGGKENLINYIFNENNRPITVNKVNEILNLRNIDHKVNDIELFIVAMTHPSYIKKDWGQLKNFKQIWMGINLMKGDTIIPISSNQHNFMQLRDVSYERYEYLGDSIVRLAITLYSFIRYPKMQEGDLTKLRSKIENSESLAKLTRRLELQNYIILGKNYEIIKARHKNENIQCDVFESFIAALYLDVQKISYKDLNSSNMIFSVETGKAFQICYDFITKLIEDEIDMADLLENNNNYKDILLQTYHEKNWGDPTYCLMETITDDDKMCKKFFKMGVRNNQKEIIGWGIGPSKQKGEQLAAKMALQKLNIISNDDEDTVINPTSELIYYRKNNKVNSQKYNK